MADPVEVRVGDSIGKAAPPGWHTTAQAARLVGKSPDRLKAWRKQGKYLPSGWRRQGTLKVWLYSDEDIVILKQLAAISGPGRPKKEER